MQPKEFISQYGKHVRSYKVHDNGVFRVKFENPDKIMWLKGIICEKMGMRVKTSSIGKVYWFEPV